MALEFDADVHEDVHQAGEREIGSTVPPKGPQRQSGSHSPTWRTPTDRPVKPKMKVSGAFALLCLVVGMLIGSLFTAMLVRGSATATPSSDMSSVPDVPTAASLLKQAAVELEREEEAHRSEVRQLKTQNDELDRKLKTALDRVKRLDALEKAWEEIQKIQKQ